MEVYIIMGNSSEYEASSTWIHSIYSNNQSAKAKLKELKAVIESLPLKGNSWSEFSENSNYDGMVKIAEECEKKLRKVDKHVEYLKFGVKYEIKKYDVNE